MGLVQRYLWWKMAKATALATPALFAAITLADAQPIWDAFSRRIIDMREFFIMLGLWLPMEIYLAMPGVVSLCVGYVYAQAIQDRELAVMQAAGFSTWQIAKPAVAAAILAAAFCGAMSLYLVPVSILEFKERLFLLEKNVGPASFPEGRFSEIRPGLEIFFEQRIGRNQLRNVVVYLERGGDEITIASRYATIVDLSGQRTLVFQDGVYSRQPGGGGKLELIKFETFAQEISRIYSRADLAERGVGFFERHIQHLLWPPDEIMKQPGEYPAWLVEGYKRIVQPLLCFAYVGIAFALAQAAFYRGRSDLTWVMLSLIGTLVVLDPVYQVVLGAMSRMPDIDSRLILLYPAAVLAVVVLIVRRMDQRRLRADQRPFRAEPRFDFGPRRGLPAG